MREGVCGRSMLCAVLAFLCVSCINTPGKVVRQVTEMAQEGLLEDEMGPLDGFESEEAGNMILRSDSSQSGGSFGPTVTPIVLLPVPRGEEQSIVALPVSEYKPEMVYQEETYEEPTVVPPAAPAQMADGVKLYQSQPASGQTFTSGQSIYLDFTLYNSGTTTWMPSYTVTDISATPLAVERTKNLPMAVAPGGTAMVSFYVVVPQMGEGPFGMTFQMKDASGVPFGTFEWNGNVGTFSAATAIMTLTPSLTPTYYSPDGITATPDSLVWMCVDPERSKLQDCYQFCVEYIDKFPYCFYDGERYQP